MITLKDLKAKYPAETKEIEVKAWGGTVVIRKLNIAESERVQSMLMNDATAEELSDGKIEVSVSKLQESQRLSVSLALVDPALSVEQMGELSSDALEGISDIYAQLNAWDKPKK